MIRGLTDMSPVLRALRRCRGLARSRRRLRGFRPGISWFADIGAVHQKKPTDEYVGMLRRLHGTLIEGIAEPGTVKP